MLELAVYTRKAHGAPYSPKSEYVEAVADALNTDCDFHIQVDCESIQDSYERLQLSYNAKDRQKTWLLGLGGKFFEIEQLLSIMQEKWREKPRKIRTET